MTKLRDEQGKELMQGLAAEEDPQQIEPLPKGKAAPPKAGTHRQDTEGSRTRGRDPERGRDHRECPTVLAGKRRSPNRANPIKH